MSMSTGDVRRPKKLSAKAAASDQPEAEVVDDAPKGGLLPVKKARGGVAATTGKAAEPADTDLEATDLEADAHEDLDEDAATEVATTSSKANAAATGGRTVAGGAGTRTSGARPGATTRTTKAAGRKATGTKSASTKTAPVKAAAKSTPAKATPGKKAAAARPGSRPGSARPVAGGKGRKPIVPVRVSQGRNWGPILMFGGASLFAILIIAFGAWKVFERDNQPSWQERAKDIPGVHNYLESNPEWFQYDPNVGNHKAGQLTYPSSPPVGGVHNGQWQSCLGDVYPAEIPKEQAVHSMEHGAVWITYRPDLPKDQVDELARKVNNVEFMLMSPYPGLDVPISVQAWGYQLKVGRADDGRIDDFINALKKNATQEPQAGCSGGITDTGTVPLDLAPIG
jgi:hypothetical protein